MSWLPGKVLGAFDMKGRRAGRSERSHRARGPALAAGELDAGRLAGGLRRRARINTLDSYVEEDGRRFVRHYIIDFGAGLGSATSDVKGPQDGGQYVVEIGRTLAAAAVAAASTGGRTSRSGTVDRAAWPRIRRSAGSRRRRFDVEAFRTNRKVPAHKRMTDRDAYWGAKLVTSFTDAQLARRRGGGARWSRARPRTSSRALRGPPRHHRPALPDGDDRRRGARVVADGGRRRVCFDDLAIARGYAEAARVRYRVGISDDRGRQLGETTVRGAGARAAVSPVPDAGGRLSGGRDQRGARGAGRRLARGEGRAASTSADGARRRPGARRVSGGEASGGRSAGILALALIAQARRRVALDRRSRSPTAARRRAPPACDAPDRAPDPRCNDNLDGREPPETLARPGRRRAPCWRRRGPPRAWCCCRWSRRPRRPSATSVFPWLRAITTSDDGKVGVRPEIQYATGFVAVGRARPVLSAAPRSRPAR